MKIDDTHITSGNLLTCCVYTLLDLADYNPYADYGDGARVKCKHSGINPNHELILFNGVWRWLNPSDAVAEEREKLRVGGKLYNFVRGRNSE